MPPLIRAPQAPPPTPFLSSPSQPAFEWIRAGEQPGGQDLSKWGRNGRIEAQRALAAVQVPPLATQKEAGRGKSIQSLGAG